MIRLQIKNCNTTSGKTDKYEYLTGEEILPSDTKVRQNKQSLHILPLVKLQKNKEKQALTNEYDQKENYKEIFENIVKERFEEIKQSNNNINHENLIFYFKSNNARKRFDGFSNCIKLLRKILYY